MEINSYILKPGHEMIPFKTYADFVNVNDIGKLLEVEKDLDNFYLDGAIEIKTNDQTLLELNDWDLVDQLWSYILNIIEEYNINGESEVYFPDSPNKIKIKRMYNDYLMFSIVTDKERKIIINKNEIFGILLKKAKDFFNSISVLKDYKDGSLKEIERAEKIAGDTLEADYNREY